MVRNLDQQRENHVKKVIVAAGGWSSKVFEMLNICIPIKGSITNDSDLTCTKNSTCLMYHSGRHLTIKQSKAGSIIIGVRGPQMSRPTVV